MTCDDCDAACCRAFDFIEVCEADVKELSIGLHTSEAAVWAMTIEPDHFHIGLKISPCPFLKNNRCSVYPHRPRGCRDFEVDGPKCQEARSRLIDTSSPAFSDPNPELVDYVEEYDDQVHGSDVG